LNPAAWMAGWHRETMKGVDSPSLEF